MKKRLVIIIDDDPILRFTLRKMLIGLPAWNLNVIGFENGVQAMDYFQLNKDSPTQLPDMLFVDINMPVMSGWELMDEIKRSGTCIINHIPVFILSSSTSLLDRERIKEYPFINGYLVKPLKKAELLVLIDSHLSDDR